MRFQVPGTGGLVLAGPGYAQAPAGVAAPKGLVRVALAPGEKPDPNPPDERITFTVARRSGDEWYLDGMTVEEGRTLEIPFEFLGNGSFEAEIWADAYDADGFPDRLMKQTQVVTATDTLSAVLAPAGGHMVRHTPLC